jgi:hypothetical protein
LPAVHWNRRETIIAFVAAIAAVVIAGWFAFRRANRAPLSEREIATRVLAEYVRKTANPHAVLVLSNPYAQKPGSPADVYDFEKAGVAGLRKGFEPAIEVKVAFPKIKPEAERDPGSVFVPSNTTTVLSYLIADTAVDDLIRENPDCDVLVSLIGLAANTLSTTYWSKPGAPRFALLLPDFSVLADPNAIRYAFKSGKIIAAVIAKPGVTSTKNPMGTDYKAEFDKRYILVTKENVDELLPLLLR